MHLSVASGGASVRRSGEANARGDETQADAPSDGGAAKDAVFRPRRETRLRVRMAARLGVAARQAFGELVLVEEQVHDRLISRDAAVAAVLCGRWGAVAAVPLPAG